MPIFLVGLNSDLRDTTKNIFTSTLLEVASSKDRKDQDLGGEAAISVESVEAVANEMKVAAYKECSAVSGAGLSDLIECVVREVTAGK